MTRKDTVSGRIGMACGGELRGLEWLIRGSVATQGRQRDIRVGCIVSLR